jgi:citrate lyase beta subunit
MKSYFFIPANKEKYLKQVSYIKADELILDLEDAIHNTNVDEAVNNILKYKLSNKIYVRVINTFQKINGNYNYLSPLLKKGFHQFIFPKVEDSKEIEDFTSFALKYLPENLNLKVTALIENPKALHYLDKIAQTDYVEGFGLGSHDYCESMGMEHTSSNILWARMKLLNTAKAFGKITIDIASMNIVDEISFKEECHDGISKGFDAKFIIHPWQLNILINLAKFSAKDVLFAKKVKQYIEGIGGVSHFTIAKIEGQIVEKPHLKRINNILKSIGYETI